MFTSFGGIFTLLLTAAGTLLGWVHPFTGLMIYYTFAILRPEDLWFWAFQGQGNKLSLLVALSVLVGWFMSGFGGRRAFAGVWVPMVGLGVYLIAGFSAYLTHVDPRYDLFDIQDRSWNALQIQLKIGLMAIVTLCIVQSGRQIRTFAWVILASVGYLAWMFNSKYYFDNYNQLLYQGFGGIDNNGVAMIMVMGVPLAFFLGVKDPRWWVKGLCFFAALLLMHVVLFSFSRGGQLGLIMVGITIFIVALLMLPNKGLTLFIALIFVVAGLRLAGPEVRERFWTIFADPEVRDASAASRFDTWMGGYRCMLENPMGVGPRNFNKVSQHYGLPRNKSVHNLFLQTGADYGIAGALGLYTFYVGSVLTTFRMTHTRTAKRLGWARYFGHMVCVSLGGFLVCSTFIGMESVEVGFIVGLLGLCTVAHVRRASADEPAAELTKLPELEEVPEEYLPAPVMS
jgi:putative inorganic carbon (hco3(-)) transporter